MITTITGLQIISLAFDYGIGEPNVQIRPSDKDYCPTTEAWIAGPYSRKFIPFRNKYCPRYIHEKSDCDDYRRLGIVFAGYCFRMTQRAPEAALAVAEFDYARREDGAYHAIQVFVCRGNRPLRLVFYEPQTASIVNLTEKEIRSCTNFRP